MLAIGLVTGDLSTFNFIGAMAVHTSTSLCGSIGHGHDARPLARFPCETYGRAQRAFILRKTYALMVSVSRNH
jgi:hypothetical protein